MANKTLYKLRRKHKSYPVILEMQGVFSTSYFKLTKTSSVAEMQ